MSQFCSDQSVNALLNYSKIIVEQICGDYDRNKELKIIQYLIFAGMVSYYGFEHIDEISRAFRKNKFFYTKLPVADFLKEQNVSDDVLNIISQDDTCAYFYQSYFYRRSTGKYFSEGKIVVSDNNEYAPDMLLEYTTHEVNHAVNSVIKNITPVGKSFISRIGMHEKDHRTKNIKNMLFEETVNVLQTAEIMDHILSFTDYEINDLEIKYMLDSIKYAAGFKRMGLGYYAVTPIIRPLYETSNFKYVLKERRMDGNVSFISSEFDAKAGKGTFDALSGYLDNVHSQRNKTFSFNANKVAAERLVKQYVRY